MPLQIVTLQDEHLDDAAALVAARYRGLRRQQPLLPTRYESAATIAAMLQPLAGGGNGVAALRRGRLVGFLSGFVIPELLGKRSLYSPEWANGAELEESRFLYEEMYRHVATPWVAQGCFVHAISMLGNDRQGIEGWHWLGFGLVAIDALRDLTAVSDIAAPVQLRRAGAENAAVAAPLFRGLQRHLAGAPAFWIHEMEEPREWLARPGRALWIAYEQDTPVGCLGAEKDHEDGCQVLQDEATANVTQAFTQETARDRGIGTALLNQVLDWARAEGYERCAVDFEAMNVLGARFWTRWFDPVCFSLLRHIDERVADFPGGEL